MLKHRARAVFLLVFAALVGYFVYSSSGPEGSHPFRLGLDLSGGSHLVYQADISKIAASDIGDAMTSLRNVVERRVNLFGVSEPLVQTQQVGTLAGAPAYRLIVELPGVTDIDDAIRAIGATPSLEFKLASASDIEKFRTDFAQDLTTSLEESPEFLALFHETGLTGRAVSRASVEFTQSVNQPVVGLTFNADGRDLFASITGDHVGDYLGIFLDGSLISWPTLRDHIVDGRAQISGNFTVDQAKSLVRDLNYGALPIPIELVSTQTIGPSLGHSEVNGGIRAGIVAFIVIAIFLIAWYRLPGLVATVALAIYTALMLALFKAIPVTLTAAGIAGFILSIGMAVDANILIFERMREELARGRAIPDAMREGFSRAWLSIRDSNISSIITGAILYYFGSTSVVTGFALVFVIGVIVSMFTAITASRLLLYAMAPSHVGPVSSFLINNGFRRRSSPSAR